MKEELVKCGKCNYIWRTKASTFNVTCPNCGYKTRRNNIEHNKRTE